MPRILTTISAVPILALAGCASHGPAGPPAPTGTPAQQQALARYIAYAGPPIQQFTWLGHFYSWEDLGRDQLVVFTTPSDAYLLKVWPACDLRFDFDLIGISSTASTVSAHTDEITVHGPTAGPRHCPIDEIRKIDYRRMRADQRAQAQQAKGGAAPPASPPAQPQPPQ